MSDSLDASIAKAQGELDAHTVEIVHWHFSEATGCPFWLEKKKELPFDPLTDIKCFEDLNKFPDFEDEWLRGGPVRRWVPQGLADQPVYVFETGGTTGIPKSRIAMDDFRTDYSQLQRYTTRRLLPTRQQLADARPQWPSAVAFGCGAPGAAPWRHLLLHRPRSAVGDQAHQKGLDGSPGRI